MAREVRRGEEAARGQNEMSHEARSDNHRRLQERIAALRKVQNMDYSNPMAILKDIVPPGWEYAFKRIFIRDFYDQGNWGMAQANGWEPVPADRHPELALMKDITVHEQFRNSYFYKGGILCERPLVISLEHRKRVRDEELRKVNDLETLKNTMNEAGIIPGNWVANKVQPAQGGSFESSYDESLGRF